MRVWWAHSVFCLHLVNPGQLEQSLDTASPLACVGVDINVSRSKRHRSPYAVALWRNRSEFLQHRSWNRSKRTPTCLLSAVSQDAIRSDLLGTKLHGVNQRHTGPSHQLNECTQAVLPVLACCLRCVLRIVQRDSL